MSHFGGFMSFDVNLSRGFLDECNKLKDEISQIPTQTTKRAVEDSIEVTRNKIKSLLTDNNYRTLMAVPHVRSTLEDVDTMLLHVEYDLLPKDSKINKEDLQEISKCMKKIQKAFEPQIALSEKKNNALLKGEPARANDLMEVFDEYLDQGDLENAKEVLALITQPAHKDVGINKLIHTYAKQQNYIQALMYTDKLSNPDDKDDKYVHLMQIVRDLREKIADKTDTGENVRATINEKSPEEKTRALKFAELAVAIAGKIVDPIRRNNRLKELKDELSRDGDFYREIISSLDKALKDPKNSQTEILKSLSQHALHRKGVKSAFYFAKSISRSEDQTERTKAILKVLAYPSSFTTQELYEINNELPNISVKNAELLPYLRKAIENGLQEKVSTTFLVLLLRRCSEGVENELWLKIAEANLETNSKQGLYVTKNEASKRSNNNDHALTLGLINLYLNKGLHTEALSLYNEFSEIAKGQGDEQRTSFNSQMFDNIVGAYAKSGFIDYELLQKVLTSFRISDEQRTKLPGLLENLLKTKNPKFELVKTLLVNLTPKDFQKKQWENYAKITAAGELPNDTVPMTEAKQRQLEGLVKFFRILGVSEEAITTLQKIIKSQS